MKITKGSLGTALALFIAGAIGLRAIQVVAPAPPPAPSNSTASRFFSFGEAFIPPTSGGSGGGIASISSGSASITVTGTTNVTISQTSAPCDPGEQWTYEGTDWACTEADPLTEGWICRDDFLGVVPGATIGHCSVGLLSGGTLGYAGALASTPTHPGIPAAVIDAVNDRVAVVNNGSNVPGVSLGTGADVVYNFVFQLSDLSDGTDTYWLRAGFIDSVTADSTDGVYFEYDSTADASWRCKTASNAPTVARTVVDSTIDVVADTWIHLRIEVDQASVARFYIDGVQRCGDMTDTIPTGVGRETGFGFAFFKAVGTAARTLSPDVQQVRGHFTGAGR